MTKLIDYKISVQIPENNRDNVLTIISVSKVVDGFWKVIHYAHNPNTHKALANLAKFLSDEHMYLHFDIKTEKK